ncbi:MAG TPA: sigma-70 family RNA polymerase sigma factor [Gemmataceae bacterium]|nr:sigma-70 family RNA polymerase sigma factor [Gemmataceae bacterium]
MNTTSLSLLQRLRRPDEPGAWERFVRLYTPLIYDWARRAGLQESDAADLVQDVFVLLLRKLPEFEYDRHGSFRAWLHAVTLNLWRTRLRRKVLPTEAGLSPDGVPAPDCVAEIAEAEYRDRLVRRALELLRTDFAEPTWRAFWECVVNDRPTAEVAADLGMSAGAVRTAKCRVLARLRQELDGLLS